MRYTLMHKNVPVIDLTINGELGNITSADTPHSLGHLPIGVLSSDGVPDLLRLAKWWKHRAIPPNRPGLERALNRLKAQAPLSLVLHCNGLSLSDQYWIRPKADNMAWEDINFFRQPFAEDMGKLLLEKAVPGDRVDWVSPDCTTDGWLTKRWEIIDGVRCLTKGGTGPLRQEPLNEALAAAVMRRLGVAHVDYTVVWEGGLPYSVCPNFLSPETEFVTAFQICETRPLAPGSDLYAHYLGCCDALGIHGIRDSLDRMIVVDYIIANSDRHYGNFGAIRNADTLEWLGPAPLFDNGTSLWNDTPTILIAPANGNRSRAFFRNHYDQLILVTSFDWLDISTLDCIEDMCAEVFAASLHIDDERRDVICRATRKRLELLQRYAVRQK
ncbi:MAG: excisionase [Firmicutes bacterium]|nr:excisionase [Bacillota bacterium]